MTRFRFKIHNLVDCCIVDTENIDEGMGLFVFVIQEVFSIRWGKNTRLGVFLLTMP